MNKGKIGGTFVAASVALMAFLGTWEGEGHNTAYLDAIAGGVPTICKGITNATSSRPIKVGDVWTDQECAEEEARIMVEIQENLFSCLKNKAIHQNTFDSLSSMSWNVGWPKVCTSQAVQFINRNEVEAGCSLIAFQPSGAWNWSVSNGQLVEGLHNRRVDEYAFCIDKEDYLTEAEKALFKEAPKIAPEIKKVRKKWED